MNKSLLFVCSALLAGLPCSYSASLTMGGTSFGGSPASSTLHPLLPTGSVNAVKSKPKPKVPDAPTIAFVHGKIVAVSVPAGFQSVTLQQRALVLRSTAPGLAWTNLGVRQTNGAGGVVTFTLRSVVAARNLRVVGDVQTSAPGPGKGPNIFLADPAASGVGLSLGGPVAINSLSGAAVASTAVQGTGDATSRTVSESDIWKVAGDRLYFFNELRGLQVFDISQPDNPALLGQLRIPASGEQMYLLDPTHVALVTSGWGGFPIFALSDAWPAFYRDSSPGKVIIADVSGGQPLAAASVNYAGYLVQSRLVGHVLYVVSEDYSGSTSGLRATSFDLADPAHPVQRDTMLLGNYGGVVTATDQFLYVVSYGSDWTHSNIDLIDISSPTGGMIKRGRITTAGLVNDKFKIDQSGSVLTVVSAVPNTMWWNAPGAGSASKTTIQSFTLANPDSPVVLGALDIAVGEGVRATRFADGRLYVVTYFQIDPLWVIDLSKPEQPTLLGELKVPGFSNYIDPLGDRLVAIGYVGNKTAVSLFDVKDPANPQLLSQIPLGDGYSYSEANWDEKAFSVVPEENLILVPYSGYDAASGYSSKVQLIDLLPDSLAARGVIDHAFAARRTAVQNQRIFAISSSDLLTVDFSNRDQPKITSDVEIAWRVDRVFLAGNYLVEIGGSVDWASNAVSLTVSGRDTPDLALTTLDLGTTPVIGATVHGGRLYVAQQNSPSFGFFPPVLSLSASSASGGAPQPPANPFILSVYELSQLPALTLLGRTEATADAGAGFGGQDLLPAWPRPDVLTWVRQQPRYYPMFYVQGAGGTQVVPLAGNASIASSATLTLNAGNTVPTTISSGTLNLSNTGILSNGALTGTAAAGGLVKTGAGTLTLAPGAGTLTLTGQNTYTGATVVSNGVLQLATINPANINPLTLANSGTLAINNGILQTAGSGFVLTANNGVTTSAGNGSIIVTNPLGGGTPPLNLPAGTFTVTAGIVSITGANFQAKATTISGGSVRISAANLPHLGPITLSGSGILQLSGTDPTKGASVQTSGGALTLDSGSTDHLLTGHFTGAVTTTLASGTSYVGSAILDAGSISLTATDDQGALISNATFHLPGATLAAGDTSAEFSGLLKIDPLVAPLNPPSDSTNGGMGGGSGHALVALPANLASYTSSGADFSIVDLSRPLTLQTAAAPTTSGSLSLNVNVAGVNTANSSSSLVLQGSTNAISSGTVNSVVSTGTLTTGSTTTIANGSLTLSGGVNNTSAGSSVISSYRFWPWYGGSSGDEVIAFDVSNPTAPSLVSKLQLRTGSTGSWSAPFTAGGKLYVSYMAYDEIATTDGTLPLQPRKFRNFLKVVDFTDAAAPVVGPEISVPGQLLAVEKDGSTLLTVGPSYDAFGNCLSGRVFHSSSFDGLQATLVDQLTTATPYDPYAIDGETLLIVVPSSSSAAASGLLQAWRITDSGSFALSGQVAAGGSSGVFALHGLAVSQELGAPRLFDVSDPAHPVDLGIVQNSGWIGGYFNHADGGSGQGLWLPLGSYGVDVIDLTK